MKLPVLAIAALFPAALPLVCAEITYTADVAPILYKHCATCHHPDDIAPMTLLTYRQTRPWAAAIREAVLTRQMPPWKADPHYGKWANDWSLSDEEIATIKAWVDQGAKEGDPQRAARGAGVLDRLEDRQAGRSNLHSPAHSDGGRPGRIRILHRAHQFHRRQVDRCGRTASGQSQDRASRPRVR